ncbi:hypothetical protein PILCRDRAFT_828095 [Piloderma croceum F 1598]|uniref:Uncharacterized protein n=1 Tax=Piloderma croceum (strain F 1598) TaxID=765440 RepID=A0A0C3EPN8_PILCF|nr:hypothetical protein PILCRDRAFT_828095 [Piloderma croceum F 1598]
MLSARSACSTTDAVRGLRVDHGPVQRLAPTALYYSDQSEKKNIGIGHLLNRLGQRS